MDCLTSLRAIVQHPESPPDPADHIGAAIVARVLDDATAPLSVTAAACASLICHPARTPAVCSSQMARAVRAIVSCDEADSPLTQDSHFFEPHFRCVVLQLLGAAAPMIAQLLADDVSVSHSLSDESEIARERDGRWVLIKEHGQVGGYLHVLAASVEISDWCQTADALKDFWLSMLKLYCKKQTGGGSLPFIMRVHLSPVERMALGSSLVAFTLARPGLSAPAVLVSAA